MKIVMISKACYVAAYRRKLEELARLPDVDLTLIAPPYWRLGRRRAALEPGNDRGYRTLVRNPVLNGQHHLHFYPGLARLLAHLGPDLVHVDEEPYDFVTFHALRAARAVGAKAIFFTWQNLDRAFPPPFGWFERWTLRRAAGAIAGNASAAAILRQKGFAGPLATLPQFGVDPDVFGPDEGRWTMDEGRRTKDDGRWTKDDGRRTKDDGRRTMDDRRPIVGEGHAGGEPVTIGYAGRLVEEKGLLVLLEAVCRLEGDWRLRIVGEGRLRPTLERLIAGELEHAELVLCRSSFVFRPSSFVLRQVSLEPPLPSAAMADFYRGLDVLVLPSLTRPHWKEQFGRVLVEAMACGVAVVGSDSGEIPHVIGDAGLVVPEGDAAALGQALARLVGDAALRRHLGQAGRARVLTHFTQRHIAAETAALYRRVMSDQ